MEVFTLDVEVARDAGAVREAFWRAESWPQIAPHVRGIDILYQDARSQVLVMKVESRGHLDSFQTVRIAHQDGIFYFQPSPPNFLRRHSGWWFFRPQGPGTLVTSRHEVELDLAQAERFLRETGAAVDGPDSIRTQMVQLISNNSRQTMLGLKRRMEEVETP